MPELFGREFNNLDDVFLDDLQTLERESCIYTQFWRDKEESFSFCRVKFEPDEIVQYVDAISAYNEYAGYVEGGLERNEALENISYDKYISQVREYNEWAQEVDQPGTMYSLAAFLGEDLEALVCGSREDRYEFLQETYTGDRRFLLDEIIQGFPQSLSELRDRDADRPDFEMECEQDFQDLFYALLKPIFPDARPEEYTPKHATKSKRIDFVVPNISTVIEAKYIRNQSHANSVSDELKVDIESYHKHTNCKQMYAIVWDEEQYINDKTNFENDLSGPRTIEGTEFQVDVRILP